MSENLNMTLTEYTNRTLIASYKLPKEPRQTHSTVLALFQFGDKFTMYGGEFGEHTIHTTDKNRVRAHWAGYVSNNRGRTVKPATIKFAEVL
jgi:hypothetical protein